MRRASAPSLGAGPIHPGAHHRQQLSVPASNKLKAASLWGFHCSRRLPALSKSAPKGLPRWVVTMLDSPLKQKAQMSSCGVRRVPSSIGLELPKNRARLMRLVKLPSLMATPASSAAAPQRAISLHGRFDTICSKPRDPGQDTKLHEFNAWTMWRKNDSFRPVFDS